MCVDIYRLGRRSRINSDTVSLYGVKGERGKEEEEEEEEEDEEEEGEQNYNSLECTGQPAQVRQCQQHGGGGLNMEEVHRTGYRYGRQQQAMSCLVESTTANRLSLSVPPLTRAPPSHLAPPTPTVHTPSAGDLVGVGGGGAVAMGECVGEATHAHERRRRRSSNGERRPRDDHAELKQSKEVQPCRVRHEFFVAGVTKISWI